MSHDLVVHHLDGDRFAIDVRGHTVLVDQPMDIGGNDTAPTPTELFIAGLASCVAFYARRYVARHHIDPAGLTVSVSYEIGGRPTRVQGMKIVVTPPVALPADRRDGFLAVASHCTVHNTLTQPADVEIVLAADVVAVN
jgi:putative redox protein